MKVRSVDFSPPTRQLDTWISELENDADRQFLLHAIIHGFDIIDPLNEGENRGRKL